MKIIFIYPFQSTESKVVQTHINIDTQNGTRMIFYWFSFECLYLNLIGFVFPKLGHSIFNVQERHHILGLQLLQMQLIYFFENKLFEVPILTHDSILIPTLLVKYYKDYLDIQGCGRGEGWVTCFKVGDVFSYVLDITYANSRQKISSDMTCGMSRKKLQLLLK